MHKNLTDVLSLTNSAAIEAWFHEQWQKITPLFYCSVDIRNAGFKIAPVDTNLFPGGFNNLDPEQLQLYAKAAQEFLQNNYPQTQKILLIAESHTRNLQYFHNIAFLQQILLTAGYATKVAGFNVSGNAHEIILPKQQLSIHQINAEQNLISISDFVPDIIILNNDLSDGVPEILQQISQPVLPSPALGWSSRLKSNYFRRYQEVSADFADYFHIDSWLLAPLFYKCHEIDFMHHQGEQCLMHYVDDMLQQIKYKYRQYEISDRPFVIVKADAGTYGMAVMTVHDQEEIPKLNRKQRTHMSVTKGKRKVTKVIIQEGVPTIEKDKNNNATATAESVMYILGNKVVGGFHRTLLAGATDANLNTPGMQFTLLNLSPETYYSYSVIARLAALAAAHEAKI